MPVSRPLSHQRPTTFDRFWFGVCYYPDHWDAQTRAGDAQRMAAAGINVVRLAEFAWDLMEPEQGTFNFTLFDDTIKTLGAHGISTILGTPTAAPPRWITAQEPDLLRIDEQGRRLQHGSRQHACTTNPSFKAHSRRITAAMARHFAGNPLVIGWQTDNELHCHFSECHCPACQVGFQQFLAKKYETVAALNVAWGAAFWAQSYTAFSQVETPKDQRPTWINPHARVDYLQFISDAVVDFQREQVDLLRAADSRWFITHNGIMRNVDYRGPFSQDLDVMGFDVYPMFEADHRRRAKGQAAQLDHARACFGHFIVPEQQSGAGGQNGYLQDEPRPGEQRRMAYSSIAHGADALLFFRWRSCRFGAEMYWLGLVDHDDVPRRRYHEAARLGRELARVGPALLGTTVAIDAAVATGDYQALKVEEAYSLGLPGLRALEDQVHGPMWTAGLSVGYVHPSDVLDGLRLFIIPHWSAFDPAWVPRLAAWVAAGGILVIGARTGSHARNGHASAETRPGCLRDLAGVTVSEYSRQNRPDLLPYALALAGTPTAVATQHWYEILAPEACTTVEASWQGGHLTGQPAITRRTHGQGAVWYVGTFLTEAVTTSLLPRWIEDAGLRPALPGAGQGVEVVRRVAAGRRVWCLLNHTDEPAVLTVPTGTNLVEGTAVGGPFHLPAGEVAVIQEG